MRILLVNYRYFISGGPEKYMFNIKKVLEDKGHEVIPFSIHSNKNVESEYSKYFVEPIGNRDVTYFEECKKTPKVIWQMLTRSCYSMQVKKAIQKEIKEVNPDIVYILHFVNKLSPSVIRGAKQMGIPVMLRLSDYFLLCPRFDFLYNKKVCEECLTKGYKSCIKKRCVKNNLFASIIRVFSMKLHKIIKVYRDVDAFITPSTFLKNKLIENGFPEDKIHCIPTFTLNKAAMEKQSLGTYGLYFGRITEEKGVSTIIKAYEKLPQYNVKIMGDDTTDEAVQLKQYVLEHKLTNVEFLGFKSGTELEEIIQNARFTIIPSIWYDNLPNTALESFQYAKPVIASNIGSLPELVSDGVNGYLFNPYSLDELADKIRLLDDDNLIKLMGDNSKRILEDKFSLEKHYCALMDIFHKTCEYNNMRKKQMQSKKAGKKLNGTIIVTYRCNARCSMCNRYKAPSKPEEEISIETIKKLPQMYFTNITGGEPFIRTDLKDIVRELYKKSDRIVISTNGFFTERIIDLCKEFPNIGIRISIEGLEHTNDVIRGIPNGYQKGYQTLKKLRKMGMKDVGFGMTVQDKNAADLIPLYHISNKMGMEFATASLHNSFYFVETKNIIRNRPKVAKHFEKLINALLKSKSPKKWFRAYFNHGLINYIYGQKRLLPCDMSFNTFFIDPYGDVMPCNGTEDKEVMGNLNIQAWDELWNSPEAEQVRRKVRGCSRNCWMIGSVSPAMHKYIWKPAAWVFIHKIKAVFSKHPYSMYENKICRDYRDGKVTKEELDQCSTCDMFASVNNGLSVASIEQLSEKTGEEIVRKDLAKVKG